MCSLAGCTTGSGIFAPILVVFMFSFLYEASHFFSLSCHSSKNRCGWEVDILTYAYLQTPTPYPHTHLHTHGYSIFTQTALLCQQPTLHKQMCHPRQKIFHFTRFCSSLLLSTTRQTNTLSCKRVHTESILYVLSVAQEEAVVNQLLVGVNTHIHPTIIQCLYNTFNRSHKEEWLYRTAFA